MKSADEYAAAAEGWISTDVGIAQVYASLAVAAAYAEAVDRLHQELPEEAPFLTGLEMPPTP
jgi:hypothetical protein